MPREMSRSNSRQWPGELISIKGASGIAQYAKDQRSGFTVPRTVATRPAAPAKQPLENDLGEDTMVKICQVIRSIIAGAGLLLVLSSSHAWAHGGVSIEKDLCVLKIGPYMMHFTGYQPELAQSQEFCEDIPYEGKAIVVLDQVDKILRDMPTDFRVVKDVKNLGTTAQYKQLGSPEEIEAATLYYDEPKIYPRGTQQYEFDFGKGKFIGIVTIDDERMGKRYVSVFPFSVGYGLFNKVLRYGAFGLAAILIMVGIFYFAVRKPLKT